MNDTLTPIADTVQGENGRANALAFRFRLTDILNEYETKLAAIPQVIKDYELAGARLKTAACISGTWGNEQIDIRVPYDTTLLRSLLKSAWLHVYNGLNIESIASADDKKRFKQAMEKPAPFTLDNIRASFGDYLLDPRGNILRGLAEVFCNLDPAYKSHERVKIGVAGLPKRVIIGSCGSYYCYGADLMRDILNALAAFQRKPMVTRREIMVLFEDENALLEDREFERSLSRYNDEKETIKIHARGVRLRRFSNGNGHLFFEPDALRDINLALAEYYGDVLADCSEEKPKQVRPGTAVSKDLQYYPTPVEVVERVLGGLTIHKGNRVLEPSCGCGRFLDALRKRGADTLGIEVDHGRAAQARAKGHSVLLANFLETVPTGDFDRVVANPPFSGRHYAKHIEHALKFLKPGGTLTAILPITARYDHGLLDGRWEDLPVGSFRESGTNINTTVLTMRA